MAIFGLLGRTLSHSWSVPIHNAMGTADYKLIELEPDELAGYLKNPDIRGLNVTIPYKRAVMPHLAEIAETAKRVGSVNTIVNVDGNLVGHNTDLFGLQYAAKKAGIELADHKVVIFGSGGASLAAQAAASMAGAREIVVISRTGKDPNNYESLDHHEDADILINATPVGMYPETGVSVVDPGRFPKCIGAIDMIYNPLRTKFLLRAQELGLPNIDGLPMLVAQAAAAEDLFYGRDTGSIEKIDQITADLRRDMINIVLVGMPGSGKTTVGTILSEMTGRTLFDIDVEIIKVAGCPIAEIFAKQGEAEFRRLERETIEKAGKQSRLIIATGGGAVKDERNYAPLHQNGCIFHIERDISLLPTEGRPLSQAAKASNAMENMYQERLPLYKRFRDGIADNNGTPHETAKSILNEFARYLRDLNK